jgi:hypothetical protein
LISWWALLLLSLGYVSILFAIAYWGDIADPKKFSGTARATIYGLTLAVYCTSWTFYGAVGSAVDNGWGYLPIYLGPMIVIFFGWGMIHRIVKISKRQNLTSIADFIAARYGKARSLAVLVTIIATIGSVPYIALQLKAVVAGFDIVSNYSADGNAVIDTAFVFASALAVFAILFGTRKIDVTEHHDGMMRCGHVRLAVARERSGSHAGSRRTGHGGISPGSRAGHVRNPADPGQRGNILPAAAVPCRCRRSLRGRKHPADTLDVPAISADLLGVRGPDHDRRAQGAAGR